VLGAVKHELSADDLNLAFGFKVLDLLVEPERLPDLVEHGSDNKTISLGHTHKLIEALWANMACSECTDARYNIVGAGLSLDGVGQVRGLKLVVSTCLTGDVQHTGAEVNAVDLLGSELSQVDADETSATASVKDLHGRCNEVILPVTRSKMLKDSFGNKRRSLVLLTIDHIIVVGAGPVIIQLGHVLDVQVAVRTSQVGVVTMDVLVRVNGGCGGHDGYCCNGVWCFGVRVVALEETVLWAIGAMEEVVVRKICCYGSLSLWMDECYTEFRDQTLVEVYSVCNGELKMK
jgi:hypothetical protein